MKNFKIMITFFILIIAYIYIANITLIPKHIILLENETYKIKKFIGVETIETVSTANDNGNTRECGRDFVWQQSKRSHSRYH